MQVTYRCHFIFMRVILTFEMTINTKHDAPNVIDDACKELAEKLGADFIYKEQIEVYR